MLGAAGAGHLNIGGSCTRRRRRLWCRAWLSALQETRIALIERHIPGRSKTARVGMYILQLVAHCYAPTGRIMRRARSGLEVVSGLQFGDSQVLTEQGSKSM